MGRIRDVSWIQCLLLLVTGTSACPCSDPALCDPIQHSPDLEVYVFHVEEKNWIHYDWTQVTTVATFAPYDAELMCFAHSKGARYVLIGDVDVRVIVDVKQRADWIAEKVTLAKSQYMDGINLDIEDPVSPHTPEYYALTDLVKETAEAFHNMIPGSQVTFDSAWAPNCMAARCYNYTAIAEFSDFLFVMSYDIQYRVWTDCIAGANAAFNQTITGYELFLSLGIDPKKLLMGVPWYGYDYVCLQLTEDNKCKLKKSVFEVPPWSVAVGTQIAYGTIMKQVNVSRLWDDEQKAAFYNYKDTKGNPHQVWYDDPKSIALKAAYIKKLGLRGIGMWHGDLLDYCDDPVAQQQSRAMWKALIP